MFYIELFVKKKIVFVFNILDYLLFSNTLKLSF